MNHRKLLQLILAALLIGLFLMGYSASAAAPAAIAPTATLEPTPEPPPPPTPTPQPTKPTSAHEFPRVLSSVWGSSGSDVFAVAFPGPILHYDGSEWSPMNNDEPWLVTVWGSSGSDVFALEDAGTILHYDGSTWSSMESGTEMTLIGLWGSSGNDVFTVGAAGTILHYDGSTWSPMKNGEVVTLTAVWGSSASDVFAVGKNGTILHYDGSTWSPMKSGSTQELDGVWGSSANDVFAIGVGGTILHYDGQAWSPMSSSTTNDLYWVWGSSGSDVFATGEFGTILHYDGDAWSPMTSGTTDRLASVWGSSGSDVFAVGHGSTILHYDGSAWSPMSSGALTKIPTPPAKPTPQPTVELIHEKITSQALAGNLLGDPAERTVYVLLPPGYATSDKRYPVIYVLPWGDGRPTENAGGFKVAMKSLLRKGEIEEMIVVVPDGTNKLGASHFMSSPTIGDFETYVTQEVVDYVDTHYRTLPTRDSRGLAGCSNGGGPAMRLGLKYPNVFSVVAPTDGVYDESLEVWPSDVEAVQRLKELPQDISDLPQSGVDWYYQMAAGSASDPNNPPFYSEMPVRIVNGRGEFVPEVIAKIVEHDAAHEARRYVEQPLRLRGILIQHGSYDHDYDKSVGSFKQLLTNLGIEYDYVEEKTSHCSPGWEATSLKYMSDKLVFAATASSPPLTPTVTLDNALVSKIEADIETRMKRSQIPGLAISIIKDGQVAYTKGFGLAEVGTDRVVTPETVFQLGSNSKTVVAIAIMQLKEQGKIDLDAPVTDYLPYFQLADERYKEITIRQLLSHRAGLPYSTGYGYDYYDSDYQSPEYDEGSLERHIRNLTQLKLQSAPGGEQGYYSDLGFEILGDVIAKVSGQSFEAYTQEHIFAPLGMQHTSFMVRDIPPELLATPHVLQPGPKIVVNDFFPYSRQHAPSSHLLSNVDDMNRYAMAQLNQGQLGEARILPAAAYEEMWGTTYTIKDLPNEKYGLGWGIIPELAGHRLVEHGGEDIGFHSEFLMVPDDGLAVVIMANRNYGIWDLQYQLMQRLLEEKTKE